MNKEYNSSVSSIFLVGEPYMTNISFGRIYFKTEQQETITSAYYLPEHEVAVEFNLNIVGLSLPYDLYDGFKTKLEFTTRNTSVCGNGTDGFCYLTSTCGTYFDFFNEYNFKLTFADTDNYIRVPLAMFQEEYNKGSQCKLNIIRNPSNEPKVILGSNFFYGFYAEFLNDYHTKTSPVQSVVLYSQ